VTEKERINEMERKRQIERDWYVEKERERELKTNIPTYIPT
jgi:hypothetical protein